MKILSISVLFVFLTVVTVMAEGKCTLKDDAFMCMSKKAYENLARAIMVDPGVAEYMVGNGAPCDLYHKGEVLGYKGTKPCVLKRSDGETVTVDCAIVSSENIGRKTTYLFDYWLLKRHVNCKLNSIKEVL